MTKPLSSLVPGERGRIVGLDLPETQKQRVLEMGLTAGAEIEVVRFAPMGDPMDIRVRGYHLSLRRHEAESIRIELLAPPA